MAWRGIIISNPTRLSLDQGCILAEGIEGSTRIATEDIAYMVLDSGQISLSSVLLSRLAESCVLVISCDSSHLPSGALLPLQGYARQAGTLRLQLSASKRFLNGLWKALVISKVANQGRVLEVLGKENAKAFRMLALRTKPGDPQGIEARAARMYFQKLFSGFRRLRQNGDIRNTMLNYTYAILRAGLARGLAAQGFHSALGIHHASARNSFNLADDLIEPWRPVADLCVVKYLEKRECSADRLETSDRQALAGILITPVQVGGEMTTVTAGIERMVDGFYLAMKNRDINFMPLPSIPDGR